MADLYKVQRIIGKRIRDSKFIEYKVKWQGYPTSQSTWQPVKHLKTVQNLIEEFETRNKDKLPPTTLVNEEQKSSKFGATLQKKFDSEKSAPKVTSRKGQESKSSKKTTASKDDKPKIRCSPRLQTNSVVREEKKVPSDPQDLDIEDIDIEEDVHNLIETSNGSEKGCEIIDVNLENIAFKIVQAAEEKKKGPKVLDVYKKLDRIYYLTQDGEGNKQFKDKQYVWTHLSRELIEFYQSKVPVTKTFN